MKSSVPKHRMPILEENDYLKIIKHVLAPQSISVNIHFM